MTVIFIRVCSFVLIFNVLRRNTVLHVINNETVVITMVCSGIRKLVQGIR